MPARTIIPEQTAERVAETLKAIGHPVRLQIIALLQDGEMCVGEIVTALQAKPAITSQQLNKLKDKGVLRCRRDGTKVYYRIANRGIFKLLDCIYENCEGKIEND